MQRKARAEESIVLRRLGFALRSEAVALQSQESYAVAMVCKDLPRRWNDLICYGSARRCGAAQWRRKNSFEMAQIALHCLRRLSSDQPRKGYEQQ